MPKPFDSTLKELVEHYPDDWLKYLDGSHAARATAIDADLATITSEADKVLRVESAEPWLLHVELQAGNDRLLPRRVLKYNVLLDERHDLPVRSVIVLLRREADSPEFTGTVRRHLPGAKQHLEFTYDVVRVWKQPVEAFLNGGPGLLPLAPLADVPKKGLPPVIKEIRERLSKEVDAPEAAYLLTASFILTGLRCGPEETQELFRGVLAMRESSGYQLILAEGRTEGRAEGLTEGRTEGAVGEARKLLLLLGSKSFGAPDDATRARIAEVATVSEIENLVQRILDVSAWSELFMNPAQIKVKTKKKPSSRRRTR